MTYRITFLRHAESEGNAAGILQGQSDVPLTEKGLEQARQLTARWQSLDLNFDLAISSPLQRARLTAETITAALNIPLIFDPNWTERDFGVLEGQEMARLRQGSQPVDFYQPYDPIGQTGESMVDVYRRALLAVQEVLRRPPGRYLVISHGAFLTRVMYVILGITPQGHYNSPIFFLGNTAYLNLTYDTDRRQWRWFGLNNPDEWDGHRGE
jgi:broad specificity phosphatase PhoE